MVFGHKTNSRASTSSRGRKTAQQKRKEKRRQRLGIAGLVFAGVLAGYGIERGINYVSSNWNNWFCGDRTEAVQDVPESERVPRPLIPDEDKANQEPSDEPAVEKETSRQPLENLDEILGRYAIGDGNINANLLAYNNGDKFSRELENLTVDNIYNLTHFFEDTGQFYSSGEPELESQIDSEIRNVTIPTAYGDLELYNIGYVHDDSSKNLHLNFSNYVNIVLDETGSRIRENRSHYVDSEGRPKGIIAMADLEDNVSEYAEQYRIVEQDITEDELEDKLYESQGNGYINYIIFPKETAGVVASVPEAMEDIALRAFDVLFGEGAYSVISREYTSRGARTPRTGFDAPRPDPTDPDPEPSNDGYRFREDAASGRESRSYDPLDTMGTRPSRDVGSIMDRQSTGTSSTPVENDGTSYDRPQRPRR